jgi:nicotinic acid mononucleotide adenylyltransferase
VAEIDTLIANKDDRKLQAGTYQIQQMILIDIVSTTTKSQLEKGKQVKDELKS